MGFNVSGVGGRAMGWLSCRQVIYPIQSGSGPLQLGYACQIHWEKAVSGIPIMVLHDISTCVVLYVAFLCNND